MKHMKDKDKIILMSVLAGIALVLLIWTGILLNDTKTSMKETHNTLDLIEENLTEQGRLLDELNEQYKLIIIKLNTHENEEKQ